MSSDLDGAGRRGEVTRANGRRIRGCAAAIAAAVVAAACSGSSAGTTASRSDSPVESTTAATAAVTAASGADNPVDGWAIGALVEAEPRYELSRLRLADRPWPFDVPTSPESPVLELRAGLDALVDGRVDEAAAIADRAREALVARDGALFAITTADFRAPVDELEAPWTSSLTQGLALALFDRLAAVTGDEAVDLVAQQLAAGYLVAVTDGGFTRFDADGAFFAEYPTPRPSSNFDGGATATLALDDHLRRRPDAELRSLLDQAYAWWDANIGRFGVPERAFGTVIEAPALALAAEPQEVLFRIVGTATVDVATITVTRDGVTPVVAVLGDDDDLSEPIQPLFDAEYHNWTGAVVSSGRAARRAEPDAGIDDQAPFRFVPPWSVLDGDPRLVVDAHVTGPGTASLDVFNGVSYVPLAELMPADGFQTISVRLVPQALVGGNATLDDPARFAHLVTLTGLLADAAGSATIEAAASRWLPARGLVPGAFDARALPSVELDLATDPVLPIEPGPDAVHDEYAGVFEHDDGQLSLLYSAYGDDLTWRVRLATSQDRGMTWDRRGTVIEGADFGFGSVAFADIVRDETTGGVLVAFSADTSDPAGYDAVMIAAGPTPGELGTPTVAVPVGGLDPAIWLDDDGYHLSFTVVEPPITRIEHYTSTDGRTWSRAAPLYEGRLSIYTQNTFLLDDTRVWVLNIQQRRRSTHLFCRDATSGVLEPIEGGEIGVTDLQNTAWNQYRYGLEVLPLDGELVSFYNGIRLDTGDGNGMIGRARLDLDEITVPERCERE